MISGLMSTSKKRRRYDRCKFIEELQENYDPDILVESIHMKTSDGTIYFYGATSFSGGDGKKEEE